MNSLIRTLAAALIAGGIVSLAGSADAVPLGAALSFRDASTPALQPCGGGSGAGGVGASFKFDFPPPRTSQLRHPPPRDGYSYAYPDYYADRSPRYRHRPGDQRSRRRR
jgi:hypothetical protein